MEKKTMSQILQILNHRHFFMKSLINSNMIKKIKLIKNQKTEFIF